MINIPTQYLRRSTTPVVCERVCTCRDTFSDWFGQCRLLLTRIPMRRNSWICSLSHKKCSFKFFLCGSELTTHKRLILSYLYLIILRNQLVEQILKCYKTQTKLWFIESIFGVQCAYFSRQAKKPKFTCNTIQRFWLNRLGNLFSAHKKWRILSHYMDITHMRANFTALWLVFFCSSSLHNSVPKQSPVRWEASFRPPT